MAGKRTIFEEATDTGRRGPVLSAVGALDRPRGARRAIRLWLIVLGGLVVVMILVGGLTRLTDAGLAITEWRPVMGALPPLDDAAWQAEFARYQAIPEYQLQNRGMTLDAFKSIYWWEWGHRQLGRLIGVVWAAGFGIFLAMRQIPTGWTGRLLTIGVLIGVQGAVGWWMVSSGLTGTALDVASYRLAIHLGLAFAILGLIVWLARTLRRTEAQLMKARRVQETGLMRHGTVLLGLTLLQVLLGALVAGIDAGKSFTDWPLMAGKIFPDDAFQLQPVWRNLFENPGLVQFLHRISGYILLLAAAYAALQARTSANPVTRGAFGEALLMLLVQAGIGIATVLEGAPLALAITHQGGAILAFVLVVRARHAAAYPVTPTLRSR